MADILSQSEMNASNPAPRILPAVLEETTKNRKKYRYLSYLFISKGITDKLIFNKIFNTRTHLIDCSTVSLCSAALTLIFSSLISLFSRSILALKIKIKSYY